MKTKPTYKELEKELKILREANSIIERGPAVIFLWKNQESWPVEFVSNNVNNIFGYSVDEFITGKIVYGELIYPDDLPRVTEEVKTNSKNNSVSFAHEPYRIISKSGEIKWLKDDTYIRRDETGKITHYEGIILEITGRKKAEQELLSKNQELLASEEEIRAANEELLATTDALKETNEELIIAKEKAEESEAKFKKLSNLNLEGIVIHKEGIVTDINFSLVKMFGYTREEFLGKNIIKLLIPEKYHGVISENIIKNYALPYEVEARTKDGILFPIEIESRNLMYNNQKIRVTVIRDITDRKKVEQALKYSEDKYRSLIETTDAGFVILDVNGKVIDANEEYVRLSGHDSRDEILGKNVIEWTADYDIERNIKEVEKCLKLGKVKFVTIDYKHKNGKIIPVEIFANVIDSNNGKIIMSLVRDITDRKKTQQILAESEEMQRKILDTFKEGIYINTPDYKIEYVSSSLQEKLGRNPIGENCYKTLYNLNEVCSWCVYEKLKEEKKNIEYEFEGENGKLLVVNNILLENNNKLTVFHDITDRKKAEEKLKESESYNKALFLRSHTPLVVMDMDTSEYIDCNKAAIKIYGYKSKEEVLGKTPLDVSTRTQYNGELSSIAAKDKVDEALKNGFVLFEWKHQRPNGDIWDAEVHLMSIKYKNKKILQFSLLDITDRKKAELALKESEVRLRESNKTKDKFFSIIAHDLKSPFSSMLGFSELLVKNFDTYDIQDQKKFINIIHQSVQKTNKLLEDLLLWSRVQRGIIDFNPETENLYLVSTEAIELLSQLAANKSISLRNEIPEDIFVKADKNMLLTILRNLISNAIKFTNKGGGIIINASSMINENNQNYAEISVKDNGVGIKPEIQPKLFSISDNVSTQGTENEDGTGLGLILCKEFVEKHDGKIWVESKIGKGSKFIFTLPTTL